MYEAHITYDHEHALKVRYAAEEYNWKYSQIDGDPVLGQKVFCYLTGHNKDVEKLYEDMQRVARHLAEHPLGVVKYVRMKIEHIIHDTKTGIDYPACRIPSNVKTRIIRDTQRDNLQISEDTDHDDKRCAVLLYIPDLAKADHEHIVLHDEQARALHVWLGEYLGNVKTE